ncbi:MAG: hypothetical protein JEZ08_10260 [Clostridiales bacterium]|nr:hypothetical protein [Clostridiales bacterium]
MRHKQLIFQMYIVEPTSQRFESMFNNQTIESTKDKHLAMEGIIEWLEEAFSFNHEFNLDLDYNYRQVIGEKVRFIMGHLTIFRTSPRR